MKSTNLSLILLIGLFICSCDDPTPDNSTTTALKENPKKETLIEEKPTVLSSFVFVGCNRVDHHDRHNPNATNASTANLSALRIPLIVKSANLESKW